MLDARRLYWLPIVATLLFLLFVGLAFAAFPHPFSLVHTNISRLGRPSMNPDGYLWLLVALLATNVPLFVFYATLPRWRQGIPAFDRLVQLVTVLNYVNGAALLGLAVWNADHRLPHRIFGGIYFSGSAVVMLLACWLIVRHPKMDKGILPLCLASAALGVYFLVSSGTASWAEWASVGLSYGVAIWLGVNAKRL
jgi:hypothetical membrane protein